MRQRVLFWAHLYFTLAAITLTASYTGAVQLDDIKLPPGFQIEIYADHVPGARSMALSPNGTLFVGTRSEGTVYAIQTSGNKHKGGKIITISHGLNMPNGVAFRDGDLYVAEVSRIIRFKNIESKLENPPAPEVINDNFPTDRHHGWKFIRFGPDGWLYAPVGAPCNICNPGDPYATIHRMKPDGSEIEIFARGVRNTVGFDWHPQTNELWFTDNGRDWLGDNLPPDELNHAPEKGMHFGYPAWHGKEIQDPEYGDVIKRSDFTQPALELGPHVAALGMRFYTGKMFPSEYHNQIFIAEHGSWNRTVPIGYSVRLVQLEGSKVVGTKVFAEGWLQGGKAWGRPVDVQIMQDGSLLVSDDRAGVIYRISYNQ